MKMFRHECLYGERWEQLFPGDFGIMPNEKAPTKCPYKIDCGQPWIEVDLSAYPKDPFFVSKGKLK
jgi:hypothetical protein